MIDKKENKWFERLLNDRLLKHTCGICIRGVNQKYKLYGSGVFVKRGDNFLLITASHVLNNQNDPLDFFVDTKNGFIEIIGEMYRTDLDKMNKYDVGFINLDKRIIPYLAPYYTFLDFTLIIQQHSVSKNFNYVAFGYPENNRKAVNEEINYSALYYLLPLSKDRVYKYYGFDEKDFMIFDFKGKAINEDGDKIKINEPTGISGCGLWVIGKTEDEKNVNLFYFLVGLMTEYRKGKYYVLIANKMNAMLKKIEEIYP